MNISLPHNLVLRPYQAELWRAVVLDNIRDSLVIWPRRNGKDLVTLNILLAKAMQRVGMYLYIAPFYAQIRSIIWEGADNDGRRFLDYIPTQLIKDKSESRMSLELINGSILKFGGADNYDALMGGNPVGIVRTEASLHKPGWEYLQPILTRNGGWALHNGTPRGMNHFFTMAENAKKNPKDWFFQHLTCLDTGYPTPAEVDKDRRNGMPESKIQQEYYCSFTASNEETFIPLDLVRPCTTISLHPDEVRHLPKIMGVDVAFAVNGDAAAIAKRQGRLLYPLLSYKGRDNMEFASIVDREARSFKPDMIFIDAGRGEGVYSRLWQLSPHYQDIVVPVNFGGTSSDPMYANMTSLMMGRLKDWITQLPKPYIPLDEDLIREITSPNVEFDGLENKVKQESKKSMRSRGVPSPNLLDAVKLTFAEEDEDNVIPMPSQHQQALGLHSRDLLRSQRPLTLDEQYDKIFSLEL